MRFGFLKHLIAYLVVNAGLFVLNLAPVGFEFDRPGVPLWFVYPLAGWGVLLLAHGVLSAMGIQLRRADAPAPAEALSPPAVAAPNPPIDPAKAGRAGALMAECRTRSGRVLTALGALGGVPVDVDDMLRGALDQAEHLTERLGPVYLALVDAQDQGVLTQRDLLEGGLAAIHVALEVLRLEAVVLEGEGSQDLSALAGPLEQLREAIMAAAEALAALG